MPSKRRVFSITSLLFIVNTTYKMLPYKCFLGVKITKTYLQCFEMLPFIDIYEDR